MTAIDGACVVTVKSASVISAAELPAASMARTLVLALLVDGAGALHTQLLAAPGTPAQSRKGLKVD